MRLLIAATCFLGCVGCVLVVQCLDTMKYVEAMKWALPSLGCFYGMLGYSESLIPRRKMQT